MVRIQFRDLRVDSIAMSSGVYTGMNRQQQYTYGSKQNEAFGKISGQGNVLLGATTGLNDRDQIDANFRENFRNRDISG